MKRSVWYLTCIFALGGMFSVCYYLSYRSALKKFEEREKQQELNQMVDAGQQAENMFLALTGIVVEGSRGVGEGINPNNNSSNGSESNNSNSVSNSNIGNGGNNSNNSNGGSNSSNDGNSSNSNSDGNPGNTPPAQEDVGNLGNPEDYGEAVPADAVNEAKILPGTKILVETYEITTGDFSVAEKQPDAAIIGMTREQLQKYLAEELENMPVSELEKGLYANELITFSENKVIVRKTYDADRVSFLYYLAVKNGEVVVYYSDLKTVFEYTGIRAIDLREEERLSLLEGIRIETAEELFSLLESYSS